MPTVSEPVRPPELGVLQGEEALDQVSLARWLGHPPETGQVARPQVPHQELHQVLLMQPGATSMQSLGENQLLALPAEGTAAGIRADAQAETALITPPTSSQRGNDAFDTVAEVDDSSHAPFVARVQRMDAQPEFAAVDGERVVGGRMYPDALQAQLNRPARQDTRMAAKTDSPRPPTSAARQQLRTSS